MAFFTTGAAEVAEFVGRLGACPVDACLVKMEENTRVLSIASVTTGAAEVAESAGRLGACLAGGTIPLPLLLLGGDPD